MENTKIEWCNTTGPDGTEYPGFTFNPWWGCQRVSPACENCYAEAFAARFKPGLWGPAKTTPRSPASEASWRRPLAWNAKAKALGVPLKVFCASMSDVFEDNEQVLQWRWRLWNLIQQTPYLNWLLLTKRPENIMNMIPPPWSDGLPANVWVGTTVESQKYADIRIPLLLQVPARVRFLSMEPLCGPVDFQKTFSSLSIVNDQEWRNHGMASVLQWVIAGGESGHQATPSHPDWFRSLRDQCTTAGVPFFFKQWGEYRAYTGSTAGGLKEPIPLDHMGHISKYYDGDSWLDITKEMPAAVAMKHAFAARVGKSSAGRVLDGKTFDQMPI